MKPFSKIKILSTIQQKLEVEGEIQALWVGGSAATGCEDELSDTDLVAICAQPERVFATLERCLNESHPVAAVWPVEQPPWPGFHQKFYILRDAPETYYIDAGVFVSLDPEDYREYFNLQRHGNPQVLFDKAGILQKASVAPKMEMPRNIMTDSWLARFEILYRTFLKESQRDKFIDSHVFYHRLVSMWLQLERSIHTPQKHDFGFRYIYRDFPAEKAEQVERFLKCASVESMQKCAMEIHRLIFDAKRGQA